jgi:hypothetical protein
MKWSMIVVWIVLSAVAGCGGKNGTPCSGATCADVGGSYLVNYNQLSSSSCKYVTHVPQEEITILQNGSDLTIEGDSEFHGTLFTNKTASFSTRLTNVPADGCTSTCNYNINVSINLTFNAQNQITGTETDNLTATTTQVGVGQGDQACELFLQLTGGPG